LSALDGSFLRLEAPAATCTWSAVFAAPDGRARPTLAALRDRVAERLDGVAKAGMARKGSRAKGDFRT
jgi:hypothetical protein